MPILIISGESEMKAAIYLSCNLFHVSLDRRIFYFCTNTQSQVLESLLVDYNIFFIIFVIIIFRFDVFVKVSISTHSSSVESSH